MIRKGIFKFVLHMILLVNTHTLKLNLNTPATAWGFQKQLFDRNREQDFYSSKSGMYHYKYDTGNSEQQMFRNEKRYADGTVVGFFGYIDPDGILRITEYIADRLGYRQRTILRFPVPT